MLRRMKGFTLIELLIVVAIIAILAAIAVPNFLEAQTRSKVARVKGDQRTITIALETYYLDQNSYPSQDSSYASGTTTGFGANRGLNKTGPIACMPTFRNKKDSADPLITLTTPVAYITSYFADPFADTKGATFSYSVAGPGMGIGYIIWSFGPDTDENDTGANSGTNSGCGGDLPVQPGGTGAGAWPPYIQESYYGSVGGKMPSDPLNNATYDPSNGTSSSGDVYRYKQ